MKYWMVQALIPTAWGIESDDDLRIGDRLIAVRDESGARTGWRKITGSQLTDAESGDPADCVVVGLVGEKVKP